MEGRPGEMQWRDPSSLRISDDDRHQVAEVLRQAAGEGRIDLGELDERLEATYNAKTYGELVPITADLPVRAPGTPPSPAPAAPRPGSSALVPATQYPSSYAFLSECARRGVWQVPAESTAFAFLGSVVLDLREALFETREVVVNANAILGSVSLVVNAGTQVVLEGTGVMGDYSQSRDKVAPEITASSPVVRVRGLALLGSVDVVRKPMPGQKRLGRSR